MTEHKTFPGKVYAVTCRTGCTLTADNGMNETVEAGKQFRFIAQTSVVYTSEPASVTGGNFKLAPAELLGLLGGGASTSLPSGYLTAGFLETTGTQTLRVDTPVDNEFGLYFDVMATNATASNNFTLSMQTNDGGYKNIRINNYAMTWWTGGVVNVPGNPSVFDKRVLWQANYKNNRLLTTDSEFGHAEKTMSSIAQVSDMIGFGKGIYLTGGAFNYWMNMASHFKAYSIKLSRGEAVTHDLLPVLDKNGVPCMFDKVSKQTFYNNGTGSFIVGMTLSQARKLGKLPAGGGTLTVSLPTNYLEDEGVVNALATAQERGWVITIQTYEAEAGAASTFALRRVWVRKRADEQGSYVDTDGFRWQVEWCVDIVGSSPEAEGYEPFRSVDVAVNYWNLQPWVAPEQEEELLNNTEEV